MLYEMLNKSKLEILFKFAVSPVSQEIHILQPASLHQYPEAPGDTAVSHGWLSVHLHKGRMCVGDRGHVNKWEHRWRRPTAGEAALWACTGPAEHRKLCVTGPSTAAQDSAHFHLPPPTGTAKQTRRGLF